MKAKQKLKIKLLPSFKIFAKIWRCVSPPPYFVCTFKFGGGGIEKKCP